MELDACGVQAGRDGLKTLQGAGVDQVHAWAHQHQVLGVRIAPDQLGDAVFEEARIGEIQALVDANREHPRALYYGEALDVAKIDRKSVVEGKSGYGSVKHGGR